MDKHGEVVVIIRHLGLKRQNQFDFNCVNSCLYITNVTTDVGLLYRTTVACAMEGGGAIAPTSRAFFQLWLTGLFSHTPLLLRSITHNGSRFQFLKSLV